MTDLSVPTRRGFLQGLGLIIAAPAIIRIDRLMRVVSVDMAALEAEIMADPLFRRNSLLTINDITREAIRLFKNSNEFIRKIDSQYSQEFVLAQFGSGGHGTIPVLKRSRYGDRSEVVAKGAHREISQSLSLVGPDHRQPSENSSGVNRTPTARNTHYEWTQ